MTQNDHQDRASAALDEAIGWHLRSSAPDAGEATFLAFTHWLEAEPGNRPAFDRVEDLNAALTGEVLEEIARDDLGEQPLRQFAATRQRREGRSYIRPGWAAGIAALAAAVAVFLVYRAPEATTVAYGTAAGQSRVIALSDGSRIEMNSRTSLSVQMGVSERRVVFNSGEAVFHVLPKDERPFVIEVGDREVRDIGTTFDVLRSSGVIKIAVAEGQVSVSARASGAAPVSLGEGDQLIHREQSEETKIVRVDPAQILSWQKGYLVYDNAPLSEVVDDLNRYFTTPIILEDSRAAAERFSGVLRIDNEQAVIKRISAFLPVAATNRADGKIGLRAAASTP